MQSRKNDKTRLLYLVTAAGAAMIATVPTLAVAQPVQGPYVGVEAGFDDPGTFDASGFGYAIFAGYNVGLGDNFILGVEARAGDSTAKRTTIRTNASFETVARASLGRQIDTSVRFGYVIGKKAMLFGRVGWENVRFDQTVTRTPVLPAVDPSPRVTDFSFNADSLLIGSGFEYSIGRKTALRISYDYGEKFHSHRVRAGAVFGF